jgi:aminoglycoside phosphotransferase (APT) family kinase protein
MDIEQRDELLAWLRARGSLAPNQQVGIRTLAGGVSNRTVLVEFERGEAWVLKQALPKLRVPVDWFCSPERITREAMGMRWLEGVAPPGSITPLILTEPGEHLLAMRAVPQPHENWKSMLLAGRVAPDHVAQFAFLLASIHTARAGIPPEFEDRKYFEALRLEPYYSYTAQMTPEAAPFLSRLIEDTRVTRACVVHGDYSPKNILVHEDRLVLLDHEVIHIGDPGFDIGFSMAHLLSKARHVRASRRELTQAAFEYWRVYADAVAPDEERCVRHSLGCLLARVAGRSQLEYLRAEEKRAQLDVVCRLMRAPPDSMARLVEEMVAED